MNRTRTKVANNEIDKLAQAWIELVLEHLQESNKDVVEVLGNLEDKEQRKSLVPSGEKISDYKKKEAST